MKSIYYFFIVPLLFSSCKLEDESLFAMKEQYVQSEGYLPLAPSNKWVYENWQANLGEDGSYEYEGIPITSLNSVDDLKVNVSGNEISYGFSPIDIPIISGLFGNLNKITKLKGKYYRNLADGEVPDENTNNARFKFDGGMFLNDSAKVGDMLYSYADTLETNTLAPMKAVYKLRTYVTGKYLKMPNYLTRAQGIDDHLAEFDSIIKVTDSLTIEKLEMRVNSIELDYTLTSISEGGTIINSSGRSQSRGALSLLLYLIVPFPFIVPLSLPQIPEKPREDGFLLSFRADLTNCRMKSVIPIVGTFNYKYNLIADNTPIVIDTYYAKGVGKIKTVMNVDQIKAQFGVADTEDDNNGIIEVQVRATPETTPVQPECIKTSGEPASGTSSLKLNLNAILRGLNITIPITAGTKTDLIQNLKYYSIRNSLN